LVASSVSEKNSNTAAQASASTFFDFLSLGGIISQVPLRLVRVKAPRQDPPRVASPDQVLRLISAAKNPRELAIIEVLYATGVRVTELARIKVEDIDFVSRKIRVDGKFGKTRYVVFGTHAAQAISALLCGRNSGYLFRPEHLQKGSVYKCSRSNVWVGEMSVYARTSPPVRRRIVMRLGCRSEVSFAEAWSIFKKRVRRLDTTYPLTPRPMAPKTFRTTLYQVALRAGIRTIPPKEFRHCCATHLLDGGADIREIQELLGHACLTATQLYTHVSRRRLLEVFDRCHPRGNDPPCRDCTEKQQMNSANLTSK
jgi:site-specific recombinase XerD